MEEISAGSSRDEFRRIQLKFATIINKDVIDHAGVFNGGADGPEEIRHCIQKQGLNADGPVALTDPSKKYVNDPFN